MRKIILLLLLISCRPNLVDTVSFGQIQITSFNTRLVHDVGVSYVKTSGTVTGEVKENYQVYISTKNNSYLELLQATNNETFFEYKVIVSLPDSITFKVKSDFTNTFDIKSKSF